ncbi:MAG: LPS assembly protein LptD [Candidatus Accumulibacter sp.]|nr:LPS assembly protein LptD [Candidatus Accumulibacter propinquus]
MTFPSRRRPLTLIFCCSVAGTFAASFAVQAQGQRAAPFRVDPVLLGLPPMKPAPAAVAAEKPAVEARPVAAPVVETRPLPVPGNSAQEPGAVAAKVSADDAAAVLQTPAEGGAVSAGMPPGSAGLPPQVAPAASPVEATPLATPATERQSPGADSAKSATDSDPSRIMPSQAKAPVPAAQESVSPSMGPPLRQVVEPLGLSPSPAAPPAAASARSESLATGRQRASAAAAPARSSQEAAISLSAAQSVPPLEIEEANTPDDGLPLRVARAMLPPQAESKVPRPVFLNAQRISGVVDREVLAEDEAELRKVGTVLTADRLTYWPVDDEVEAVGSVRLQQDDDVISGPKARLKLEDQVGFFDQASYFVKRQSAPTRTPTDDTAAARWTANTPDNESATGFAAPRALNIKPGQTKVKTAKKPANELTEGRGEAERIDFEGENQRRLTAATYTTCKPGNDDWYLSVGDLQLDYDNDVASGTDGTVRFMGVPILHSPWVSFSLNNERKSGFLTPSYGSSSDNGVEFVLPYYWNIAPNMDATIDTRILSKRGLQLGTEFRYLNTAYGGIYNSKAAVEYLPHDRLRDIDRWGLGLTHSQNSSNGFSGAINYSRVSDNYYFTDLSSQITSTAKTQLLQQGLLSYSGGGWWDVTTNVQSFQTLQPDPQNPVSKPYRLLPQITLNARQPDLYSTDTALFGQYTYFAHPDGSMVEGQRMVLQPQVSLPYVTPGWYVIPRVAANLTRYALSYPNSGSVGDTSISRTLPIFSVDSGMTFERPSNWFGRDYTQTLEPRLFYLNIPYQNQNQIPIFDTGLADFNFAQIFADNQFSGWDRINNANQLTAAVSSRLIDPSNGSEIMRAMVGQRFNFTDEKVSLPGSVPPQKGDRSDFLAAFSGQLLPRLYADAALQYDPSDQQFQRYAIGARYVPEAGKVLNATYSYNSEAAIPINQVDLSGQWPINSRWQAVGRYNYSFTNSLPVEIIGGLEYNAGCWVVRTVAHRIQTTQANSTTQFFVQLELNGFASIGSNPLSILHRRIPGYAVGPALSDPALAER